MEQLKWQTQFETGIAEIDTQHKQIVDYLNQLREARITGNIRGVGEVLDGMVDYTLSHFAFEESLMEQAGYPYASAHKSVHTTFIQRVSQFQERYRSGENVTEELHALLRRWLINHIQRDDAAYVRPVMAHINSLQSEQNTHDNRTDEPAQSTSWLARTVKKFFG